MSPRTKKPRAKAIAAAADNVDALSFETAFAELETIVEQLEAGELALEEALALFERGQALAARCGHLLESAELKIKMLTPGAEGGALAEFEAEEAEG